MSKQLAAGGLAIGAKSVTPGHLWVLPALKGQQAQCCGAQLSAGGL